MRQLGINFTDCVTTEEQSKIKTTTKLNGEITVPFAAKASGGFDNSNENSETKEEKIKPVEYNLNLAQDVSELIKAHDKYIVLENFHYLTTEVFVMVLTIKISEDL